MNGIPRGALWLAGFLLFCLIAQPASAIIPTGPEFWAPGWITEPGTYELQNDLTDYSYGEGINIIASDVYLDGMGHALDGVDEIGTSGIFVYNSGSPLQNVVITNITISDFQNGITIQEASNCGIFSPYLESNTYGIFLISSSFNVIQDADVVDSDDTGILLSSSSNNQIRSFSGVGNAIHGSAVYGGTNNTLQDLQIYGSEHGVALLEEASESVIAYGNVGSGTTGILVSDGAHHIAIREMRIVGNADRGIVLLNTVWNSIEGCSIQENANRGIAINGSNNNVITTTVFNMNGADIVLSTGSTNNTIYDNAFWSDQNVLFAGTVQANVWNKTKTPDGNIMEGDYLGGNYWGSSGNHGFSQTHYDLDGDYIVDSYNVLNTSNIDYLPIGGSSAEFSGQVFEGYPPVVGTPAPYVDVALYGSDDPEELGTLIEATSPWPDGFFDNLWVSMKFTYYNLVATPLGVNTTTGAESSDGTVVEPGWIQFEVPLEGKDLAANTFWVDIDTEPPVADFTSNVTSGQAPLAVQFTDTSTGDPVSWMWTLGDDSPSVVGQDPVHVYYAPGTYDVTLTVWDASSNSNFIGREEYITVYVNEPPLEPDFTANTTTGYAPLVVEFTDQSEGTIESWIWDFGDDGMGFGEVVVHTYEIPGTYTVELTVYNATADASVTHTDYITVLEPEVYLLQADFSANQTSGTVPLAVAFTDESVGDVVSWYWGFGDDSTSEEQSPVHVYGSPGTYTIFLEIGDGVNSTFVEKENYIVVNDLPMLDADFTANVTSGPAPLAVQFNDASIGDAIFFQWDYGDGNTSYDDNSDPVFVYNVPGTYTVSLTVGDNGNWDTETKPEFITVEAAGPRLWTVGPVGAGADFTSIQAAVNAAAAGDAIVVWSGTYDETISVAKQLTISGVDTGAGTPTVESSSGNVFTITADGCMLNNFVVTDIAGYGVLATSNENVISNLTITPASGAIAYGIGISGGSGNLIIGNTITDLDSPATYGGYAVYLAQGASDNIVSGNTLERNHRGVLAHAFTENMPTGNVIAANTIKDNTWDGICLWNVSGNTVIDNTVTGNNVGIHAWPGSNNNQFFLNNIYDNTFNGRDESSANTWTTGAPISYTYGGQSRSGTLGNYWGDYAGTDGDGNGIGDAPYTVNVTDPAPLVGIWDAESQTIAPGPASFGIETFDTYSPGVFPPGWGQIYNGRGWEYAVVDGSHSSSGSQSFSLQGTSGWAQCVGRRIPAPADPDQVYDYSEGLSSAEYDETVAYLQAHPRIYTEAKIMTGEVPSVFTADKNIAAFAFYKTLPQWGRTYGWLAFKYSPTDGYYIDAGGQRTPYQPNQWYTVRIVTDLEARQATFYVNGILLAENVGIETTEYPEMVFLSADNGGSYTQAWFDDVTFGPDTGAPIGEAPVAAFSADVLSGVAPLTVQFTDESSNAPTSWFWDFGDDATAELQSPAHTYDSPGVYTVTLTVENGVGSDYETKTDYIEVLEESETLDADFISNVTSGTAPLTVAFSDESVGDVVSWYWTFGDDSTSTEQNPVHVYDMAGSYAVSLTVYDAGSNSNTTSKHEYIVVAASDPPLAPDFSTNTTSGHAPLVVEFTDQSEGTIESWIWDFGDDGMGFGEVVVHTYEIPGTYTVELTVYNATADASVTHTDYITVLEPEVYLLQADFSANQTSGTVPLAVAFTDESIGDVVSWQWSFGDDSTSDEQSPVHVYDSPGTYTVYLEIGDGDNTTFIEKLDYIAVDEQPAVLPVAAFAANLTSGDMPLAVSFADQSLNGPTEWSWDFGDGSSDAGQSPEHTYLHAGVYSVTLTVSNANGSDTETKTDLIIVEKQSRVGLLVFDPLYLNAEEISVRDSLEPGVDVDLLTASDYASFADYEVLYMREGSEPEGFSTTEVASALASAVNGGTTLITEAYGHYLIEYAGFGSVSMSSHDPAVNDAHYFIEPSGGHPVFAGIPLWSNPVPPDDEDQLISQINAGVYPTVGVQHIGGSSITALVVTATYGWEHQTPDPAFETRWPGAQSSERTIGDETLVIESDHGTGRVLSLISFGLGDRAIGAIQTVGSAGNALRLNMAEYGLGESGGEAPVADFSVSSAGSAARQVTFTANDAGPDASYSWSFSDGTTSTGRTVVHTFPHAGTFAVTLTVENAYGSDVTVHSISIAVSSSTSSSGRYSGGSGSNGNLAGLSGSRDEQPAEEIPATDQPASSSGPLDIGVSGVSFTGDGDRRVLIDRGAAEGAGYSVGIDGRVITLSNPTMTVFIVADAIVEADGLITGDVAEIRIESSVLGGDLPIGHVDASFEVLLDGLPEGASITMNILGSVSPQIAESWQKAADGQDLAWSSFAFAVEIQKTNLTSTGPAKMRLTIPAAWVEEHGGVDAIRIARLSDEGSASILETRLLKTENGQLTFEGLSPDGLSVFGMISVKAKTMANPAPAAEQPAAQPMTPLTIVGGMVTWVGTNAPLVGAVAVVLALAGYLYVRSRSGAGSLPGRDTYGPGSAGGAGTAADSMNEAQSEAFSAIIHVLNEIDFQLKDLEATFRARGAGHHFPMQEASTIVDRFFYSCQVAEERIKNADAMQHITKAQVEDLNGQLHAAVQRMIALSRQSETLSALVQKRIGADVTS